MSVAGIHGQHLEITVVGCTRLRDTEWFSRQDPYVTIEYASTKFRTRTCTDGGKNPMFQEKFTVAMIEGLREIVVSAWNSNTINQDDFIGNGKIPLLKVLSEGYDDSNWPLQTKSGRHAGEVHVIMHYANAKKYAHGAPYASAPYAAQQMAHPAGHYAPPAPAGAAYPGYSPPTPYPVAAHTSHAAYPPPPAHAAYPPPPAHAAYPPPPHGYPAGSVYPPPPMMDPSRSVYPPPPAPYPGTYPPHPY